MGDMTTTEKNKSEHVLFFQVEEREFLLTLDLSSPEYL